MPGRGVVGTTGYRYGFNGKEDDKETVGSGNGTQDYGLRIYNPSLGKFLSVDPLTSSYPWYTPYQFAGNKPIQCIDLDGAEELPVTGEGNSGDWGGTDYSGDDQFRELNVSLNGISGGDAGRPKDPSGYQGKTNECGTEVYHCGTSINNYADEGYYKSASYDALFLRTLQGQVLSPGSILWKSGLTGTITAQQGGNFVDYHFNYDGYLKGAYGPYAQSNMGVSTRLALALRGGVLAEGAGEAWLIYRGSKLAADGSKMLYIGSAKYYLKPNVSYRYAKWAAEEMNISVIGRLTNIPDRRIAIGVEQHIMNLNGWQGSRLNKQFPTLSNKNAASIKQVYLDEGLKWLNHNIPEWQTLFKYQ